MKLKDLLSDFSMPRLANLIQNWGGRIPKSFSKEELIDQVFALIQDPARLQSTVFSLIQGERNLLGVALICDGTLDFGRLSQFAGKTDLIYNLSYYISNLQSRGLTAVNYSRNTTSITIPEELKAPLKKLLIEYRPADYRDEGRELELIEASPAIDDIFRICVFSKNRGGIRLTQQGQIFKKAKQHLFDMLGKHSEDRLAYAVSIMLSCHLLERDEKSNSLHPRDENAIRTIFSKSKENITAGLLIPLVATQNFNRDFIVKFLDFLVQKRDENWIDYWGFIRTQRSSFFEKKDVKGWLGFDIYDLNRLIYNLHLIGIIDIKYFNDYNYTYIHSFRISAFGMHLYETGGKNKGTAHHTDRPFIISPNFEVSVFAEETDYYTMYRLSKIALMLRCDTAGTFRLEKELVMRELSEGSELTEIISFLEQHSKKELPQNIRYSLLDWGSKYGKVTAGKGYIEIVDRSLYERIEQIISPYIIRSINNPVILFDEKNTDEVISRLRKADIFPSNWRKDNV